MISQRRYYNYVLDYFNKNKDAADVVPPSSMNVIDPIMNQLITELLALNSQRASILSGGGQKNLFLAEIENKIKTQKQVIVENVKNNLATLNLSINELNYRTDKSSQEISKLPKTELGLVGIQRNYKLNDAIMTFLLQKRAEAEIARSSNYPDYEIIEPAREITSQIIYPKRRLNYLIAIVIALLLPTGFILIKDFFNDKITGVADLEHLSKNKVVGLIYKNKHKSDTVVADRPRSSVTEAFRTLRTNLFIKLNVEESRTILVTSSLPKEGKSFVSLNLASSVASIGYKTVLVDCDLRRPSLHVKLNIDNSIGMSSYMVNKALPDDIIVTTVVPNLYFIPAGQILPNPAELIESGACDKLFAFLRANFDYIIIDTPPLGAVADPYLLMKYSTKLVLVTRQNYTRKDIFAEVVAGLEANGQPNFNIVLNDMNYSKSSFGKYYGQYYSDEKADKTNKKVKKELSTKA